MKCPSPQVLPPSMSFSLPQASQMRLAMIDTPFFQKTDLLFLMEMSDPSHRPQRHRNQVKWHSYLLSWSGVNYTTVSQQPQSPDAGSVVSPVLVLTVMDS